jgi:hypothetical protein
MNAPLPLEVSFDLRAHFNGLKCRPDVDIKDYHRDRSCESSSGLRQMLRTPAHYRAYRDGTSADARDTPAKAIGRAIHTKVLEPELFDEQYVVSPCSDRRLKEFKEFAARHQDRTILVAKDMATIEGGAASIRGHERAHSLISTAYVEHTLIWQDEETGIWLKIRPDALCLEEGVCGDVKSTDDASEEGFLRSCRTYYYDVQAAMYKEGLRACFGRDFDFAFIAVEKDPPYGVALYGAPDEMLEDGRRLFRKALHRLAHCRDTDEWPGYQPHQDYDMLNWRPRRQKW